MTMPTARSTSNFTGSLLDRIERRLADALLGRVLRRDAARGAGSTRSAAPGASAEAKKLIFVVGPESTGTRVFADLLAQHPDLYGSRDAPAHHDLLDEAWRHLNRGDVKAAALSLPDLAGRRGLITRRSLPHGDAPGRPAEFMRFANVRGLIDLARAANLDLIVLITSRSPAANLASWTGERASAQQQLPLAIRQYRQGYRHLFALLAAHDIAFAVLSLEGLTLDGEAYVSSVFQLCGLPPVAVNVQRLPQVNHRRYEWFARQPDGRL